ncbi:MAG TPA: murein biosynthesis integral membrane protein MurJ [Anaerolineae bacterium]|nr:murein biosynthesis integral membrane protein MurJ [Anaerolineae bacterium]
MSQASSASPTTEQDGIAQAAGIIAFGSIASRVLGLIREQIIAYFFGASGLVSAFGIAGKVPKMIYELLVGGMLSAALVPVFSQVAEHKGRPALYALFSRMASLVAVALAILVLLLEALAPQVAWLLGGGFEPELQAALARMLRIIMPAVLFFGLSGVITGLLYTLKRFTLPAFGAAVFNLGTIISVPLLAGRLDAYSLAVGVLFGSLLQVLIMTPDLRGVRFRFHLNLSDPALRRILVLYLPIALGLVVSNVQVAIDQRLASSTGASSIAWMDRATTLVQLPHGMVAVAISLAVLPTLSRMSAAGDQEGFRRTLGLGLRLVLVLIVPATIGLLVLAEPLITLLFEHGRFTAYDTFWTAWALRCYLVGLVFAAIDWPLNYAFYAQQDTLTPALVGILSVGIYLAVALALIQPMGMLGLVLADSAKHFGHATTMLILTRRRLGSLKNLHLGQTAGKAFVAAGAMASVMAATLIGITQYVGVGGLIGVLIVVVLPAALGAVIYLALASLLRMQEINLLRDLIRERLGLKP